MLAESCAHAAPLTRSSLDWTVCSSRPMRHGTPTTSQVLGALQQDPSLTWPGQSWQGRGVVDLGAPEAFPQKHGVGREGADRVSDKEVCECEDELGKGGPFASVSRPRKRERPRENLQRRRKLQGLTATLQGRTAPELCPSIGRGQRCVSI
jgi:hypothetical protein